MERVGGDAAVVQVDRGAGDAVDLGDQRRASELVAGVEGGEAASVLTSSSSAWRMTMLWLGYMAISSGSCFDNDNSHSIDA